MENNAFAELLPAFLRELSPSQENFVFKYLYLTDFTLLLYLSIPCYYRCKDFYRIKKIFRILFIKCYFSQHTYLRFNPHQDFNRFDLYLFESILIVFKILANPLR